MSEDLVDVEPPGGTRRRAALTLGAMGAAAGLIAIVLIVFVDSSGHHSSAALPATEISTSALPGPTASHRAPTSATATTAPASTSNAAPASASASCPASSSCVLAGDGGVLAAVNAYRAGHGQAPVAGTISVVAQACAGAQGDGPSCPVSYFWEPVPTQDGAAVITKISTKASGSSWLLDPKTTSIGVGWVHAGSGWECTVIKVG